MKNKILIKIAAEVNIMFQNSVRQYKRNFTSKVFIDKLQFPNCSLLRKMIQRRNSGGTSFDHITQYLHNF